MNKAGSVLLVIFTVIQMFSTLASADGLLPSLDDTYGVEVPSICSTLNVIPETETENVDGSVYQTYEEISEEQFNAFLQSAQDDGCTLSEYAVDGNCFTGTFSKRGGKFKVKYDAETGNAEVSYPAGVVPVKSKEYRNMQEKIKCYQTAMDYKQQENYLEAVHYLRAAFGYKDADEQYDACCYNYAISCFNAEDYTNAITFFKNIRDKEIYPDVDEKINESYYRRGYSLYEKKNYSLAVSTLKQVENYKDTASIIQEAKYAYVQEHKNVKNMNTLYYLEDLKKANYKDSAAIYEELYKLKVDIFAVNNSPDSEEDMQSISKSDKIYFHYRVVSGPPHVKLTIKIKLPNSEVMENVRGAYYNGNKWESAYYTRDGSEGVAYCQIEDEDGNQLDYKTVLLY